MSIKEINGLSIRKTNIIVKYSVLDLVQVQQKGMKKIIKQESKEFPKLERAASKVTRTPCDCIASVHELINNCLRCGKVICAAQGEGPCFYCGNIVSRPGGRFLDADNAEMFPGMTGEERKKMEQERNRAIQHKNVLVDRDSSKNMVQNIFDEQTDYYEISDNKWVSDEDRKFAVERILFEQKRIGEESEANNVYYDHTKGEWIKEDFEYDGTEFKKEAQNFANNINTKPIEEKMMLAKKAKEMGHADKRLAGNEKVEQLYTQLKKELGNSEGGKGKQKKAVVQERKYKGVQIIMEQ